MPPNSVAPLFDANEDILYVKSTDGAGFPTIRRFSFTPVPDGDVSSQYVTRVEFDRESLMRVLDEHMDCVRTVCLKEYEAVLSKIRSL